MSLRCAPMRRLEHGETMNALLGARAACAPLILMASPLWAQTYPLKPVRLLIGLPPGGGSDPLARGLAARAEVVRISGAKVE